MKKISITEADKSIDSRVVNTLWEHIHDIEGDIKTEVTKAWYILWFQWTILFVASTKIGWLEAIVPKLFLMISFIVSAFLSFFVIAWKKSILDMSLVESKEFNRSVILKELTAAYKRIKKLYTRKVVLNNINIIIQIIMLIGVLTILLFWTTLKIYF